jgi:hypothetical protein
MHRPKAGTVLALVVALGLAGMAMPRAVVACSCAMSTMEDARTQPDAVVFSGIVDPRDQRGYPVTVTRWFKGGGLIEPRAWLHPGGFSLTGGGADCSVPPLPIGTEWIFIAYKVDDLYSVGLCSPHAALATAEGQAMLGEAVRVFGGGAPPATAPPVTPPPAAPSPPTPAPTGSPAAPVSVVGSLGPIAIVVFIAGILLGVVSALRRMGLGRG